ncbi:hypothetical protein GGI05_007273, partial [Coemansia sp. RSA 2603]
DDDAMYYNSRGIKSTKISTQRSLVGTPVSYDDDDDDEIDEYRGYDDRRASNAKSKAKTKTKGKATALSKRHGMPKPQLSVLRPPHRDSSRHGGDLSDDEDDDPEFKRVRQEKAAELLRKQVRMYKRQFGKDLADMPGMAEIKAKIEQQRKKKKVENGESTSDESPETDTLSSTPSSEEEDDEDNSVAGASSGDESDTEMDRERPTSIDLGTLSINAANKQIQDSAFKTTAMVLTDNDYGSMHKEDDFDDDAFVGLHPLKGGQGKPIYNSYSIMSASARMRRDRKLNAHTGTRGQSEPASLFSNFTSRMFLQQQQQSRMAGAYGRLKRDSSGRREDGYSGSSGLGVRGFDSMDDGTSEPRASSTGPSGSKGRSKRSSM